MITKNPMQLKAFIKKKAEEKHISAQLVMQNYMMERLLERISLSPYKRNFILKGGFLIAAIVGIDTRATMDLDTTIKGFDLTHEAIRRIFEEVCAVKVDDDVVFTVMRTTDIREGDDYPGLRVALTANYSPLAVPLTVDVTTGDKITPREVEYSFKLLFDNRTISILAYNLETILAEKLETVLSRNIANTRPRDFYDIHILHALRGGELDAVTLKQALEETARKRGSLLILARYREIVKSIRTSPQMQGFWEKYRKEFDYAKDIVFDDACNSVLLIMDKIKMESTESTTTYSFKGTVELFEREKGWYYVSVPTELSRPLEHLADRGLIAIAATVGRTSWLTSLLPMGDGTHFIALPAKVRSKEKLLLGDMLDVSFQIRQRG